LFVGLELPVPWLAWHVLDESVRLGVLTHPCLGIRIEREVDGESPTVLAGAGLCGEAALRVEALLVGHRHLRVVGAIAVGDPDRDARGFGIGEKTVELFGRGSPDALV